MIEITVFGTPGPQGSKRHVGKGVMIESSKIVKPWREAVVYAAMESMHSRHGQGIRGAVQVEMTFTLKKPKRAPKYKTFPDRKPDISKLVRSTEDALTDAGAWDDDARVVDIKAGKRFPNEGLNALHVPGAVIRIWSLTSGGAA